MTGRRAPSNRGVRRPDIQLRESRLPAVIATTSGIPPDALRCGRCRCVWPCRRLDGCPGFGRRPGRLRGRRRRSIHRRRRCDVNRRCRGYRVCRLRRWGYRPVHGRRGGLLPSRRLLPRPPWLPGRPFSAYPPGHPSGIDVFHRFIAIPIRGWIDRFRTADASLHNQHQSQRDKNRRQDGEPSHGMPRGLIASVDHFSSPLLVRYMRTVWIRRDALLQGYAGNDVPQPFSV